MGNPMSNGEFRAVALCGQFDKNSATLTAPERKGRPSICRRWTAISLGMFHVVESHSQDGGKTWLDAIILAFEKEK